MVPLPVGMASGVYLFPIIPVHPRLAHYCVSLTPSRSDPSLCCRLCSRALGPRATILRVFIRVPGVGGRVLEGGRSKIVLRFGGIFEFPMSF